MARTVNRNQTLEEFRNNYNALAGDVGSIDGLAGTINNNDNLVDAINEMENRTFYFDSFTFTRRNFLHSLVLIRLLFGRGLRPTGATFRHDVNRMTGAASLSN